MQLVQITPKQYVDLMLLGVPCYAGGDNPDSLAEHLAGNTYLDLSLGPDERTITDWSTQFGKCWTYAE